MNIYLSGITRDENYEVLEGISAAPLVIDYSYTKTRDRALLERLRESRRLMAHIDTLKMEAACERAGAAAQASKLNHMMEQYAEWAHQNLDLLDLVICPQPKVNGCYWEFSDAVKAKGIYSVKTATRAEALSALEEYLLITTLGEMPATDMRAINTATGRACFHTHASITKDEVMSGLYASGATSSWLSGAKFGNTYEYVGALKMTTHHGSKGSGKAVRDHLKGKCARLGIDHSLLMQDDRLTVNTWNAHQWILFINDAAPSSALTVQADTFQQLSESDLTLAVSTSNALTTPQQQPTTLATQEAGGAYLRVCNSCFLSATCPAYKPDANCSVSTRPRVDTPEDLQQLLNRVIEIQGERVMFSAFAEKNQNMGLNPDVSREIQTLTKIVKEAKEIMAPISEEITIKARGPSVMNSLFGGYGRAGGGGGSKPSQSEAIIDVSPLDVKKK
jgi:hypothetical protein